MDVAPGMRQDAIRRSHCLQEGLHRSAVTDADINLRTLQMKRHPTVEWHFRNFLSYLHLGTGLGNLVLLFALICCTLPCTDILVACMLRILFYFGYFYFRNLAQSRPLEWRFRVFIFQSYPFLLYPSCLAMSHLPSLVSTPCLSEPVHSIQDIQNSCIN